MLKSVECVHRILIWRIMVEHYSVKMMMMMMMMVKDLMACIYTSKEH